MNTRKWKQLSYILVLSFLTIVQYQNCGQAPQTQAGANPADLPSDVTVIDDVKKDSAVAFVEKSVQVHSAANVISVDGLCSSVQAGATLRWVLRDQSGAQLEEGLVECAMGSFQVQVAPAQSLECGKSYKINAQLGLGRGGEVTVERRCAPSEVGDASSLMAKIAVSSQSQCLIEKSAGGSCSLVCYEGEKVSAVRAVTAAECAF